MQRIPCTYEYHTAKRTKPRRGNVLHYISVNIAFGPALVLPTREIHCTPVWRVCPLLSAKQTLLNTGSRYHPPSGVVGECWPRNGTALCGACWVRDAMPDADDACIVSRSPRVLELIMMVFEIFGAFCMTVSKNELRPCAYHADSACAGNTNSLHSATWQESALRDHPPRLFKR